MAPPRCGKCGKLLKRVTIKREGKWYCDNCKETK